MWRLWIILGIGLSACAEFPQVDRVLSQNAATTEYPALVPFEQLLNAEEPRLSDTDDEALRARSAALRNRAKGLRPPVIDRDTRDRMDVGIVEP